MRIEQRIEQEIRSSIEQLRVPNIAVIGMAGAGKSTLINSVFGENKAKTGDGETVTVGFNRYTHDGNPPIVLFDSAGYTAGNPQEFTSTITKFLEKSQNYQIEHRIHLVWYVVNAAASRVTDFDLKIITAITNLDIPVVPVISKCDIARDESIKELENALVIHKISRVYDVVRVAAEPMNNINPSGLEALVSTTLNILPDIYELAVIASQRVLIKSKRKVAWTYIRAAALACFSAAFVPMPGTTAAATSASQYSLLRLLVDLYDCKYLLSPLLGLANRNLAALLTITSTFVLDTISLIFPPAFLMSESVAGLAGSAYIITVGLAVASVLEKLAQSPVSQRKIEDEIRMFLRDNIQVEMSKYSKMNINSKQDIENIGRDFLAGSI